MLMTRYTLCSGYEGVTFHLFSLPSCCCLLSYEWLFLFLLLLSSVLAGTLVLTDDDISFDD